MAEEVLVPNDLPANDSDDRPVWRRPQISDVPLNEVTLAGGAFSADQDPNQVS